MSGAASFCTGEGMRLQWNPWHGCRKYSEGCLHCYVYRTDALYGRDSSRVVQTAEFDKPLRKKRDGEFLLAGDEPVFTCFSSDFFLEEADVWRPAAWRMIRARPELSFFIVTKRILRFSEGLPADWGDGYENVTLCCTVENRRRAAEWLPHFLSLPIRHKQIICEPLLERISLSPYLGPQIERVLVGGESGPEARVCDYDWVLDLRAQCREQGVSFCFRQTGARFRKDGRVYAVERREQHRQAKKANIDIK